MSPATDPRSGVAAFLRRPVVLLALALLLLAVLMSVIGRLAAPPEVRARALTQEAGTEVYASFSPDGKQVAYSGRASGPKETFHIFVHAVAGGAPRQVTSGAASDIGPVWSPDGSSLAFVRLEGRRSEFLILPAAGGAERKVAEFTAATETQPAPSVTWTKDGRSLVVSARTGSTAVALYLVPASGGKPAPLFAPPEGSEGDTLPAVSPDGLSVAFTRRTPEGSDIWISPLAGGAPRRITFDNHQVRGLAWTADSREIVYSSNRGHDWNLWRIPAAGGTQREYLPAGRFAQYPAVGAGGRLVYSASTGVASIWRAHIDDPASERSVIRPQGRASSPSFSPDGRRIAYIADQGSEEIWVADADGANATRITNFKSLRLGRPRWSPDGKTFVLEIREAVQPDIWTVAVEGGKAKRLTTTGSAAPSWSPDGKWIYYGQRQVWRMAPDGTGTKQITQRGGSNPRASADGKWIYYHRAREIWKVPAEGGEEERIYSPEHNLIWGSLVPDKAGLYFMEWDFRARTAAVMLYDFEEEKASGVMSISRADFDRGASFDISPDRKWVVYPKLDQTETNLMVIEGFR